MGDVLRQLLYPLLLPAIVAVVWFSGWVKQMDYHIGQVTYPAHGRQARPSPQETRSPAFAPEAVPFVDPGDVMATFDGVATAGDEWLDEP